MNNMDLFYFYEYYYYFFFVYINYRVFTFIIYSGGQCRQISLAITLLHDPQIIILDEPTVGIDPLLRYE